MTITLRSLKGSDLTAAEADENIQHLANFQAGIGFGLGADTPIQTAAFSDLGITGSAPVTTWSGQLGAGRDFARLAEGTAGSSPALQPNGAVRVVANGSTSNAAMATDFDITMSNRILFMFDVDFDLNSNVASYWTMALDAASEVGFAFTPGGIYEAPSFTSTVLTHTFARERCRFGMVLDRAVPAIWCVRIGDVTGYREWTQSTVAFADWTTTAVRVVAGNNVAIASRVGTHDFHAAPMLVTNIPAFATNEIAYKYIRESLNSLKRWSSPFSRKELSGLSGFSPETLAGVPLGSTTLQSLSLGTGLALDGTTLNVTSTGQELDPVETTSTTITISDSVSGQNLISTAAGAVTVTLGNATNDNKSGAITEGAQEITVSVAAGVQYYLEGDNQLTTGRTASFKVRGAITWMVKRIDTTDRRYLILGGTDHEQDIRGVVLKGYRANYAELTGAQTLTATVAPAGCTRANTGTTGWTLPSRIPSGTTASESIVVHNFHASSALSLTASGPTPVGATSLAAMQSGTIEWCRSGTGTERVIVRVTV